jgi:PIN domain nuclease of toxin-antitoxin system
MNYLLDTHTLLWWMFDSSELSTIARGIVSDRSLRIYVSPASAWEIATKFRNGRLPAAGPLVQDFSAWVARAGFAELALTVPHAVRAGSFPQAHKDPFDRMLAAQSLIESLPILSTDDQLQAFGATVVW